MTSLRTCPTCAGFVPSRSPSCPVCGAQAPRSRGPRTIRDRLGVGVLGVVGGGTLAVTLSACYGAPCVGAACYERDAGPVCRDLASDRDGDGYCGAYDCNESSAEIHDNATDPSGDGVDQNCDGIDGYGPRDSGP